MRKFLLSVATMFMVAFGAVAPVMAEENTWPTEEYTDDNSYIERQAYLEKKMEEYCRENGKMTPSEIRSATANVGTIHSAVYALFPFGVGMGLVAGALGLAAHFIKVQKYRDEKQQKDAFSNASSTGKQYKDATQDGMKDATQDDVALVIQLMQGAEKSDTDFDQYHLF